MCSRVNLVLTHPQPELLVMVLSQLELRDLTRALSVSKYWHQTILGTIELRQNLFLAPKEKADELLQWKQESLEWEPFIIYEPTSNSKPILKVHPVLLANPTTRTCLDTLRLHGWFQTVSPSTLLTQPPVTGVKIEQHAFEIPHKDAHTHKFVLERLEGVTFGDVVEGMRVRQARESSVERAAAEDPFASDEENPKIQLDKRYTRIEASRVVAEASNRVRTAGERMEQEHHGSGLDR